MKLELAGAGRWFGALQAVAPVDLTVAEGEFIAIVGPSGCGKSTLLRMVSGLIPASEGEIRAGGRAVRAPVTELGIVFQQPVLLEWRTALDNVLFQVEMRGHRPGPFRGRALELLDQVGLKDFAHAHPHALSGGMRQRVAIARALVHDPGLLLMDEPFGALDALTREQMRVDLEALWLRRRMTVLFVTHSVDEAVLLADRVVVMSPRPGRVDQVLNIDLPRPRGLAARRHPEFLAREEEITEIFLARGILRREAA
ncbi:MAG: ABC transporter ATP-binding protein [Acetobacteraceae bacterium]|nr:ABC transporter ATP-binding protein [Acetobacteraceae bacterium]